MKFPTFSGRHMKGTAMPSYTLGLDLGTNSVGWAMVAREGEVFENGRCILAGVRVFPEGVPNLNEKKEQAPGQTRREKRSLRRVTYRRRQRRHLLRRILTDKGLLPCDSQAIAALMKANPYELRARGLAEPLKPHEIGRALYHLCQRRGFKSNRKTASDDENKVTKDAGELQAEIEEAGCRTLGQYRAKRIAQKEDGDGVRVRGRYTLRAMYEHEFETLWAAQAQHRPDLLTDALKAQVHEAIFYQRPLRFDPEVIGDCELEEGEKRCPRAHWMAERFRMLQEINNLRVVRSSGETTPLNAEERAKLAEDLGGKTKIKFSAIRKCLGLLDTEEFNLESEGKRDYLYGNRVEAALRHKTLRKWYDALSAKMREAVHTALATEQDPEELRRLAQEEWGCTEPQAEQLLKIKPLKGHLRVSLKAIRKMLPYLQPDHACDDRCRELCPDKHADAGHVVSEAKARAGYELTKPVATFDRLPPVDAVVQNLTNPLVRRALTETRKVVNGLVREYGPPAEIVVELARDMKHSKERRRDIFFDNVRRRKENDAIRDRLVAEFNIPNPSRQDVIKYRLWDECGGLCVYTGKNIPKTKLFSPQVQVEHIYPLDRSLDDSYLNKTLCYGAEVNRIKGGRTPYEAYHDKPEFDEILQRAKRLPWKKRRRFTVKEVEFDDFAQRQLNDTRYASRLATRYLRCLRCEVRPVKGQTTSKLGHYWGLYGVLGTDYSKARDDHRYHAIDALVVALTTRSHLQRLSGVVGNAPKDAPMQPPWEGFWDDVRETVHAINVSHRPHRKLAGGLHEDTGYGPTDTPNSYAYRVPVERLTPAMVGRIRDPVVQQVVRERLVERGIEEKGSKAFGNVLTETPLTMPSGVPIKRVRITTVEKTAVPIRKIGDETVKYVKPGGNHHLEIYQTPDGKWTGRCVSRLKACERLRRGEAVVDAAEQRGKPDVPDGSKFLMSLAINDMVQLTDPETGEINLYRVQMTSHNPDLDKPDMTFRLHWAARIDDNDTRVRLRSWHRASEMAPQKVSVDPIGQVFPCND
jgi:CRISPR-associated endonuclease Csn1